MTIELMINRLIGQGESGGTQQPLAPEESRALSQRLRALVDEEEHGSPDRGPAAEALQLAAYLDGAMDPAERAAFERELVRSPERRDELMDTAAWLEAVAARSDTPPADATDLMLAMDTPARAPPRAGWFVQFIERLLPRPRLALATSALASVAIAVVGFDIALRLSPLQVPSAPAITEKGEPARPPSWMNQNSLRPTESGRLLLTAETINALMAYLIDPAETQRTEVLRCLARAGAPAFDPRTVHRIVLQPPLPDRLRQRDGSLPVTIAVSLSLDGTLRLESAD